MVIIRICMSSDEDPALAPHVYSGAFIQNWLINYGATCPAGWTSAGTDCYVKGRPESS
jgi:hypothetical protein